MNMYVHLFWRKIQPSKGISVPKSKFPKHLKAKYSVKTDWRDGVKNDDDKV